MAKHSSSLTDELERALGDDHAHLVDQVRKIERVAQDNISSVVRNGRFPNWPFERWLMIAVLAGTASTNIFNYGGVWNGLQRDVKQIRDEFAKYQITSDRRLDDLSRQLMTFLASQTKRDVDYNEADRGGGRPASTGGAFPQGLGAATGQERAQ